MANLIVHSKLNTNNFSEAIERLGYKMVDFEMVKKNYIQAVIEREQKTPTALETKSINVAIPHTDTEYVNETTIAVATMMNPIDWNLMANPSKKVGVEIIFLLAVSNPEEQTDLLKTLMSLFQNEELLKKLKYSESDDELKKILKTSKLVG